MEAVGYAQAYSFAYSARPGTPAAARPEVAAEVKAERLARLQALLGRQRAAYLAAQVGRVLPVLIEKPGRLPGQVTGRTPYLDAVHCRRGGPDRDGGGGPDRGGGAARPGGRAGRLIRPADRLCRDGFAAAATVSARASASDLTDWKS